MTFLRFLNFAKQLSKVVSLNSHRCLNRTKSSTCLVESKFYNNKNYLFRKFNDDFLENVKKVYDSVCGLLASSSLSSSTTGYHTCIKSTDKTLKLMFDCLMRNEEIALTPRSNVFHNAFLRCSSRKDKPENDRARKTDDSTSGKRFDQNDNENNDNDDKLKMTPMQKLLFWFFLTWIAVIYIGQYQNVEKVLTFDEFSKELLSKGEVEKIIINLDQKHITIKARQGAIYKDLKLTEMNRSFLINPNDFEKFEDRLRETEIALGIKPENSIPVIYSRIDTSFKLISLSLILIFGFLMAYILLKYPAQGSNELFSGERKANFMRVDLLTKKGKGITFQDVAGLHEAKIEIMEFVDYLKNPKSYQSLGAKIPRGALLLGPPGCGKTLLAKAVATEAKVPFLAMAGSEFVEMLGGLGAARVRDLFKEARSRSPCIVYIDEIDAIGRKRSGDNWSPGSSEEEHTLNQLLVEMDGIGTKEGVIVLGSTNRAEVLDKALLRAGRFDRHILIDFPTLKERMEIFEIYLKTLKLKQPPRVYSENLAQMSPGMSGADIANICNEAALHAARLGHKNVDFSDFDYAVERVTAGVAKKSRVLSELEKKVVSYHEAGHALVGWLLEHTNCLLKVSIIPRTNHVLGFAHYIPQDRHLFSSEALFQQMSLLLGGRVAESLTFNSVTSGAEDDLKKVTKMAYDQVRVMGMNERVGLVSFPTSSSSSSEYSLKPFSKETARMIDHEARLLVAKVYKFTEKLLTENKEKLKRVAEALLEKETLSYSDMEQLIGPPPFGKKQLVRRPISEDGGDQDGGGGGEGGGMKGKADGGNDEREGGMKGESDGKNGGGFKGVYKTK